MLLTKSVVKMPCAVRGGVKQSLFESRASLKQENQRLQFTKQHHFTYDAHKHIERQFKMTNLTNRDTLNLLYVHVTYLVGREEAVCSS